MREIIIEKNDSGQRLDRFLNKYLPKATGSFLQKMIRTKKIKCNKKRAKENQILMTGDRIQIYLYEEILLPLEKEPQLRKSKIPLSIVYEDEDIAVIDKAPGVLTHAATPRDYGKNIVDAFVDLLISRGTYKPQGEQSFRPALANRLDYDTGGLLIGLKNHQSAMKINQALTAGSIEKYYLCYCEGRIDDDLVIDASLEKTGKRMKVSAVGKKAITRVHPLYWGKDYTYAQLMLETGRYHQIRAHMASIGHPLIGDERYGRGRGSLGKTGTFRGQLLLSYALFFKEIEDLPQLKDLWVESFQKKTFEEIRDRLNENRKG